MNNDKDMIGCLENEIELLKSALKLERECVDFYADRYKWNGGYFDKSDKEELHGRTIGGKRARECKKERNIGRN